MEVVGVAAAAAAVTVKFRSWGEKKSRRGSLPSTEQNRRSLPTEAKEGDRATLRRRARAAEWAGARRHEGCEHKKIATCLQGKNKNTSKC